MLAASAIIGAAAASSYYPHGYYGGYYPASYGWYGGACYSTRQTVWSPYGWRRVWVSSC